MAANELLRAARLAMGWERPHVADRLNEIIRGFGQPYSRLDANSVYRWERGLRTPEALNRRALCLLYQASAEQLGLGHGRLEGGEEDEVRRRRFLTLLGLGALGTVDAERLMHAVQQGTRLDRLTLSELERATLELGRMERQVGPRVLLGMVRGHLGMLTDFLHGSLLSEQRRVVCSLAGETAALAGWLEWNADNQVGAARYFEAGLTAAKEAEDRALGAYLVGCAACQPFYREDPATRLRVLTGQPHGFSQDDATPTTRAWLSLLEAGVHALSGDGAAFHRASARAESWLGRPDAEIAIRRPRQPMFDSTYFAEEYGACLIRLDEMQAAREVLEPALNAAAQDRTRLWLLVDLAEVAASQGEDEEASTLGLQALNGALDLGVEPILRCVRSLSADLPSSELTRRLAEHPGLQYARTAWGHPA